MGVGKLGDLIDAAGAVLSRTESNIAHISENISNISTPGFKKNISIYHVISHANRDYDIDLQRSILNDPVQGILKDTEGELDIAISGEGYFLVRRDADLALTRGGRFSRGADGVLETAEGWALQLADGSDAVVKSFGTEILRDGTLLDGGAPAGVIGVYAPAAGSVATGTNGLRPVSYTPEQLDESRYEIRQGMIESSNVVLSDEMIAMMSTMRQAEGAAQLVRMYDQLVGQAVSTFGRSGR